MDDSGSHKFSEDKKETNKWKSNENLDVDNKV